MRRRGFALVALSLLVGSAVLPVPAEAANTFPTNPVGIAFSSTAGVSQYGHPSGMLIAGHCNRYAPEFAQARANGAEVLAYLNTMQRNDSTVCALDDEFYGGPPGSTPLWPYPLDNPGSRVNWPGTHMLDITVGSAWVDEVVAYVENLMVEDKVDGVFLDDIGARTWSATSDWDSWSQAEKDAWAQGCADIVRRIDAKRRAINPRFIVVNNNVWDINANTPPGSLAGEQYVDGISIELHSPTSAYHQRVAGKPYGNLGHRRVIAVALSTADAQQWATVQGVTHVTDQTAAEYGSVKPPSIGFHRLTDRPKVFGRTTIGAGHSGGMTADQKRGSKFTLPDKATLLSLSAYLDGQATTTPGSQQVRMALYQDNNGVPNARLAQSNTLTINAGTSPGWVTFTVPATPLNPGQYWIVLHSGATEGIARYYADGTEINRYNNLDTFADGSTNPFGSGNSGPLTLSLKAAYTVGS